MTARRWMIAALLLACGACSKGSGDAAKKDQPDKAPAGAIDPAARCKQMAATCGDDKHIAKLVDGCTAAWTPTCAPKLDALYTCYEKQLCGKADRIWAFDDLAVLSDRKAVCGDERNAVSSCK